MNNKQYDIDSIIPTMAVDFTTQQNISAYQEPMSMAEMKQLELFAEGKPHLEVVSNGDVA